MASKTITSFQGLRGYAILLIFISHCNLIYNSSGVNIFNWAGALGVSCFIFLSGFLAISQYKKSNLFSTFIKKIKKFYPLHILTFAVALVMFIKPLIARDTTTWLALISNLTLTQSWIPLSDFYFSFNSVSWYLSLTVAFILFTPLIVKIAEKLKEKLVLTHIIFFTIIVFEFIWCIIAQSFFNTHYFVYIFPIARLLDLFMGAIVFILVNVYKDKIKFSGVGVIIVSITLILLLALSIESNSEFFAASIWCLPVALLLGFLYIGDEDSKIINWFFKNKLIVCLGNISFEFFLIHQLVIKFSEKIFEKIQWGKSFWLYLLAFTISVLCAFIINKIKLSKIKKKEKSTIEQP